jgi:hypothetical protein
MAKRYTTKDVDGALFQQIMEKRCPKAEMLAKRAGVGLNTVYKMIRGGTCELDQIVKVATYLGVDYNSFLQKAGLDTSQALNEGISITCERSPDGNSWLMRFSGAITIQADSPEKSPQIQAFLEFLKASVPDGTDIRLLSIAPGLVVFSIADSQVVSASLNQLKASPKREPSRSKYIDKSVPFKSNPLDDPAYWWLSEIDRAAYDDHMKARHDIPYNPRARVRQNPLYRENVYYEDIRDWLNGLVTGEGPVRWPGMPDTFSSKEEIKEKYPWAFELGD